MSTKPRDRRHLKDDQNRQDDKTRMNLSNIIDNINSNNLSYFYPKDESLFKKRIDMLNYKFYIETEKYLSNKNDMEKCQDQLFIILFKQISLYIEEVERLNFLLKEKMEDEKSFKEKLDESNKKEKEKAAAQLQISNLKNSLKTYEKKLEDKTKFEDKLRNENDSLHRQLKFYKEQLETNLNQYKTKNKKRNQDDYTQVNNTINFTSINNTSILSDNNLRSTSKDSNPITNKNISNNSNTNNCTQSNTNITNQSQVTLNPINNSNINLVINNLNSSVNTNIITINKTLNKMNSLTGLNEVSFAVDSNINNPNQVNTLINKLNTTITNKVSKTGTASNQVNSNVDSVGLKILNKKRNYSDNNPNKKSVAFSNVNNRYNHNSNEGKSAGKDTAQNSASNKKNSKEKISLGNSGGNPNTMAFRVDREMAKSMVSTSLKMNKKIASDTKNLNKLSIQSQNFNNLNLNNNPTNNVIVNNLSHKVKEKNTKEFKIIKSIKLKELKIGK
jgi:hypothetical protein